MHRYRESHFPRNISKTGHPNAYQISSLQNASFYVVVAHVDVDGVLAHLHLEGKRVTRFSVILWTDLVEFVHKLVEIVQNLIIIPRSHSRWCSSCSGSSRSRRLRRGCTCRGAGKGTRGCRVHLEPQCRFSVVLLKNLQWFKSDSSIEPSVWFCWWTFRSSRVVSL